MITTGGRFPGPGDFVGAYQPRGPDATEGAQSTYDGSIAVTLLDRDLVESVLPEGFHLAVRTDGANDHLVILLIGHQRAPLALHNGATQKIPDAHDYQEMILLVPFVLHGSGTKWHTFVVRMYLDDFGAIGIGNTVYAYAKDVADLTENGTRDHLTTQVAPFLRGTYFGSDVMVTGPWRSSDDAQASIPRWRDLQAIFKMPLVGIDVVNGTVVRRVCSYWEWDYTQAQIAPAISRHRFYQSFREGMDDWVTLGPLTSALDGAVVLRRLRWRLALPPPPCRF